MNAKLKAVKRAIAILSEHFPNGCVFIEDARGANESRMAYEGWGSHYTNFGMISDWMIQQKAIVAQEARDEMHDTGTDLDDDLGDLLCGTVNG